MRSTGEESTISIHGTEPVELSYDDRQRWGACPVCKARPGEWCSPGTPGAPAHLGRTMDAPRSVCVVDAWDVRNALTSSLDIPKIYAIMMINTLDGRRAI
jgi:hypothetical protein